MSDDDDDFFSEGEEEDLDTKKKQKTSRASPNKRKLPSIEKPKPVAQLPYTDRVFILKKSTDPEDISLEYTIISLPHPKTSILTRFIYNSKKNQLFEINKFQGQFSSWFINNTVRSDGSLYLTSPMDTLFLVLPVLEKLRGEGGFFQEIESMANSELYSSLNKIKFEENQLKLICEQKVVGESKLYRLDDKRLMAWLRCKVNSIKSYLTEQNINAFNASTVLNTQVKPTEETMLRNAIGFIMEYLPNSYEEKLIQQYKTSTKSADISSTLTIKQTTTTTTSTNDSAKAPPKRKPKVIEMNTSYPKISSFLNLVPLPKKDANPPSLEVKEEKKTE